ncbi:hypothetical protein [Cellulomonas carbonis]|uniref:hypothetical protein n=1 Tax=Cellulomonas carbonis TaxID=1386092 RepID=UPI0005BC173C|nr:hypothetical protein [Cellulomonas carbonis]GGC18616.1 hypothetical protein GCM10010972_34800 [Cellulomonas carbonis]
MDPNWIVVLVGVISLVAAVAIFPRRDAVASSNARRQQKVFGARSRAFQEGSTGHNMIYPAVGFAVVGVGAIILGLFFSSRL